MQFIHDIATVTSMAFHCQRNSFCIVYLYVVCVSYRGQSALEQQPEVCQNVDIRNSVEQFKKIENCTVVEGFLQIVLIDNGTSKNYENLSFPKLREITGYLLLYRAFGMTSIGKLFPELTVIRGNVLFQNYALVIYEVFQLQEIGLKSLTDIVRGSVRIEKNPNLCYVKSIDWNLIAKSGEGGHFIEHNQPSRECPNACHSHCPLNIRSGPISERLCWNSQWCQKVCHLECQSANKTCDKNGFCCHKECLGGCSVNDSPRGCRSCRHVVYNNKCYEKCPIETYQYMGWRCINEDTCRNITTRLTKGKIIHWKPIASLQSCMQDCPAGYIEADNDRHSCKKCTGHCPKVCPGTVVDSVSAAQKLSGCTMINGSLIIQINNGANIIEELEDNLKYIKEITGFLKIFRSYSLVSLNVLKNLKVIRGQQRDKQSYSLLVYNNQNLEDLWNWKNQNYTLQFGQGKIFFHFNPKLCVDKIKELRNYSNVRDWDDRDVSPSSNGDRVACNVTSLQVFPWLVCSNVAGIKWENFREKVGDQRSLLGYTVHYRKVNEKNITVFDGQDACEMNVWKVFDVEATEDKSKEIFHIITHLEPFTQYAFYIQTYNLAQAAKGAKSQINYFKTKPNTPSPPLNVHAQATSIGEIRIKWQPPKRPNGNITHYIVQGKRELDSTKYINQRDYCNQPIVIDSKEKQVVEEEIGIKHMWFNNSNKSSDVTSDTSSEEVMNDKCCLCTEQNEKKHEVEAEDQIQFEDTIHNTIYIKNPSFSRIKGNSHSKQELYTTLSSQSFTESVVEIKSDFLNTLESEVMTTSTTRTSKGNVTENGFYVYFSTVATNTSVTVSQLHHYTEYTIEVQACHYTDKEENTRCPFYEPCSTAAIASIRTLPLSNVDDIDSTTIMVHSDNTSAKTVHIQWDEPEDPNGVIVYYSIEYTHLDDDNPKPAVVCITQLQYKAEKGHHLTALSLGRYSLRLQATSLAGNGNWTKYIKFRIPDNTGGLTTEVLALVVCFTVVVFLITIMGAWIFVKRKLASRIPDDVLYASVNPEYMSTVYVPDEWEVSRDKVSLIRELGQGSFGMVWEGEAKGIVEGKPTVKCAVKTVNESASLRERIEFLQEASVMKSFNCHHVVKLLGVVSIGHPTLVVMELMVNGDLKSYLRAHRPDNEENPGKQPPTLRQFLWMAVEIADGMSYLSAKKFVHRDLAARNCMVGEDMTVKIGDFGMTRDIYETDYYRKGGRGLLPVRWMAPESLKDGVFTSQSDIWSYGVVLWEMATLASQPYRGLSNEQVVNYVVNRGIMEMPEYCPKKLYDLMRLCWDFNPKARPTFFELIEMLLPDVPDGFWNVSYYFSQHSEAIAHENEDATSSTHLKSTYNSEKHSQDGIYQSSGEGGIRFFPGATYIPESSHLINCSCSECKEDDSPLNGDVMDVEGSKQLAVYSLEDTKGMSIASDASSGSKVSTASNGHVSFLDGKMSKC